MRRELADGPGGRGSKEVNERPFIDAGPLRVW